MEEVVNSVESVTSSDWCKYGKIWVLITLEQFRVRVGQSTTTLQPVNIEESYWHKLQL